MSITCLCYRYFTICWPMKTILKFTTRKTVLIIIVNWFIAGVQAVGFLVLKHSVSLIIRNGLRERSLKQPFLKDSRN